MPIPLLPILLSKGWVVAGLDFLKKFWPYLLVIGLVIYGLYWYGNSRYQDGFNAAQAKYEKAFNDQLELEKKALTQAQAQFEKGVKDAQTQSEQARLAKAEAERQSQAYQQKANQYYHLWQEALRNGKIPVSDPNAPHYFTHGFVGMYNLAVQLPESSGPTNPSSAGGILQDRPQITVSEVATAAGLKPGAAAIDLAGQSTVDEHALLYNAQYNYRIANTCLVERQLINEYFQKLCELGFCEQ